VNGVLEDTGDLSDVITTNANDLEIGEIFMGMIDEVRISNTDRSAAWIKAAYNSESDTLLSYGSEVTPSTIPSVDIKDTGNTKLQYQADDNFMFFQFFTEGDPDMDAFTYSVLLDDGGDKTYEYAIATYGTSTNVRLYKWSAVNGWDNVDVQTLGTGYFNFDTTNDVVQFAVPISETFSPVGGDNFYAATYLSQTDAFEEGQAWEQTNGPTPSVTQGDHTIPEFSDAVVPVVGIVALFIYFKRKKKRKKLGVPTMATHHL